MTDLGDTSRCPLGEQCKTCGSPDDLTVATMTTPAGVVCVTMCGFCRSIDGPAHLSLVRAAKLSAEHAAHLGIDVDEMGRLMGAGHGPTAT